MKFMHKTKEGWIRSSRLLWQAGLIVLLAGLAVPSAWAQSTVLRVIVLHGHPGHTSVHLTRGNQQYYWDPGGNYGQELDECLQQHTNGYCRQWYAGFAWEDIKAARRHDIVRGPAADLSQVLAIEMLDYESVVDVFTFQLKGETAQRAWQIIRDGAEQGSHAAFTTSRAPMFCTKAVSSYLRQLGGDLSDFPSLWRPDALTDELAQRGHGVRQSYTLNSPPIQHYIDRVRRAAGAGPLPHEWALTVPEGNTLSAPEDDS
ncbi:MAG: hypothetical protein HY082_06450 [Gammaproteobacteria bacterium]|nr:hypothetical protein [Gammaproteobacteria bacterium]